MLGEPLKQSNNLCLAESQNQHQTSTEEEWDKRTLDLVGFTVKAMFVMRQGLLLLGSIIRPVGCQAKQDSYNGSKN